MALHLAIILLFFAKKCSGFLNANGLDLINGVSFNIYPTDVSFKSNSEEIVPIVEDSFDPNKFKIATASCDLTNNFGLDKN